jgi:hypothetical protein
MRVAITYTDIEYVETDYEYYFKFAKEEDSKEKNKMVLGINVYNPFIVEKVGEERRRKNPT